MKRSIKNAICIVLILAMCALTFGTMKLAQSNSSSNNMKAPQEMTGNMGTPPDKPQDSGDNSQTDSNVPQMPENNGSGNNMGTPPEKPQDSSENSQTSGSAPQMPENNGDGNNMSEPPQKPDGTNMPEGQPGNMEDSSSTISLKYSLMFVAEGIVISGTIIYLVMSRFNKYTFKETLKNADKITIFILSIAIITTGITYLAGAITSKYFLSSTTNNERPQGMDQNGANTTYSSEKEITEDTVISEGTFSSSTADQNVISSSGDIDVNISNITVEKTGDSDGGDNTSFYGTNSAIIAKDGANLTIENATITTDATGANGVFSYGGSATTNNSSSDGTTVTINNSSITTSKDNSGGIMTTGGGKMYANNLTISTAGTSSATIRSDRGGGTVVVDKGTYTTTGKGSPAIYSTADITVKNATLVSKASEGIVIEGKNSVSIENVELTDTNNTLNGQSTTYKNIFLYQSMSGDAAQGSAKFSAKGSKITTNKGDTIYVTNTTAEINLEDNTIINNDSEGYFLRAKTDSWGNSSSNGGDVTLNMTNQKVSGNISIDKISTLKMVMKSSSYYEGSINADNTAKSITLTLDKTSKIKLTGDSYVTSLDNEDDTNSNIDFNGYKLYVNGVAIN